MRICVLSEYFYPDSTGGSGAILSKLLRHLQDHYEDLQIDVITSANLFRDESDALPAYEDWGNIRISRLIAPQPHKHSIPRRLAANLRFTAATYCKLRKARPKYDLVMVVTAPPTLPLAARAIRARLGTPYVYLVYDLYLDMAKALNLVSPGSGWIRVLDRVQKSWFDAASRTVVLGRCMSDHVTATYKLDPKHIDVIPIPVDAHLIAPMVKETRFRARHGLDGFVVIYAGNFAKYQDFDTLLDAARIMLSDQKTTFVFVGDGSKKQSIEERIEREKLTNVRLLPFVPESELCDMLASADVSLVTLEQAAVGLAVPSKFYNILASGRPTAAVVDRKSEVGRVVVEANCGVQVDPEDGAGLAQALCQLRDSPALREQMGANARAVCEEKYTLEAVGRQFIYAFQRALHDGNSEDGRDSRWARGGLPADVKPDPVIEAMLDGRGPSLLPGRNRSEVAARAKSVASQGE